MPLVLLDPVLFTRSLVILLQLITNTVDGLRQKNFVQAGQNKSVVFWGRAGLYGQKRAPSGFLVEGVALIKAHITGNRMFFTEALPRNLGAPRLKRLYAQGCDGFLWKMI